MQESKDIVVAARKRPRQDVTTAKNITDEPVSFLTPHILRLLKLVEEGTAEHAQLAAAQLSEITAGSSPLVLWDILGRLQGYLISPHWKTRQNASVAMEGVARRLPIIDQQDFLQHTAASHRDEHQHSWLTLQDLDENVTIILEKGRKLLSSSESKYDQEEELTLQQLDATFKDRSDFVQRRIELQRQILAQRLGLSTILSKCSGKKLEEILSIDDLSPIPSHPQSKKPKTTEEHKLEGPIKSIRSLLLSEIQHQQQQQQQQAQQSPQTGQSYRAISHQNAQRLLATELVFRMFDSSWYIRHGSLMGILALLRAWNLPTTSCFGIWPQDILARCLCVMALDRFADYSETATSTGSGGIVAPVREIAGQVLSTLYQAAPESQQIAVVEILTTLTRQAHEWEDWEIRHAALMALLYVAALQTNINSKPTSTEWMSLSREKMLETATRNLSDENDDVKGKAAQLLVTLLSDKEKMELAMQNQLFSSIAKNLWKSLATMNLISSSVKDLVGLLATMVRANFSLFLHANHDGQSKTSICNLILSKLNLFIDCPYLSIKASVISLLGEVAQRVEEYMSITSKELTHQVRSEIVNAFYDVLQKLYRLYFERVTTLSDVNDQDVVLYVQAHENTWLCIAKASKTVFDGFEEKRSNLQRSMILTYFDLNPRGFASTAHFSNLLQASFAEHHCTRTSIANALAVFLSVSDSTKRNSSQGLLELCIRVCLDSPFVFHCESACLLITKLHCHRTNPTLMRVLENCKVYLDGIVQETPRCLTVNKQHLVDTGVALLKMLEHSFEHGVKMLVTPNGGVDIAVHKISAIWREVTGVHLVASTHAQMNFDSMRLSAALAGALISGGMEFLPIKLTPLVRALMTSIQNESDEDCRQSSCEHLVSLLALLSCSVTKNRKEGFQKTRSKILQNLCKMIQAKTEPGCMAASQTVSRLVSKTRHPLQSYDYIWESIAPLATGTSSIDGLRVFDAICSGVGRNEETTNFAISTFLGPITKIHCFASDPEIQIFSRKCVKELVAGSQSLALSTVLPPIASMCKSEDESIRERACGLLLAVITGPAPAICPLVRSMLPLAMQLMTDPSLLCAKAAARIFSRLVQIAPLVKDSIALRLLPDGWDEKADRVMDHLIGGKPLPPCEIHPDVEMALISSRVSLRQYQLEGVAWLRFLQTVKLNGALTDSMGLGKTLQALVGVALAHTDAQSEDASISIVICPSSVLGHWMKEVERFFPRNTIFRPFCLQGPSLKKEVPATTNLIITSYSVLRTEVEYLSRTKWCYCVLDEGHLLKNPKTATAKAARRLQAKFKLILTGTPVQNKVQEVWATFDFLMPNFLGSSSDFAREFARPISKGQTDGASAVDIALGMDKLKLLHQQVLPFILRREKQQVLQELPPKIITTIPCEMTSHQLQLYEEFCSSSQGQSSLRALHKALQESSSESTIPSLGSNILKALLYLRLVCTHPALVDADGMAKKDVGELTCSGKLTALKELLRESGMRCEDLVAADNDTSLMYVIADECDDLIHEEIDAVLDPGSHSGHSSSCASTGSSKCLIFAQFTLSLDVVEKFLGQHFPETRYLRLDGKVPIEKRAEIVDSFNSEDGIQILLLTTRIGGLGLNLTGADTVIFLEHDWNPHADLQAMDRAHRIGQKKTVNVYKLVTVDSIEEKIMKLHETKLAMSDAIVNAENSSLYSMGTDQLLDIFRFRSDKSDQKPKDIDTTLDLLLERYEEEYTSLSLVDFIDSFKEVNGT